VLLLGLCLVALRGSAQAQTLPDPIEGTWSFSGGAVTVVSDRPGHFVGTVTQPTRFEECTHPAGQRMWDITAAGGGKYTGTHVGFHAAPGCEPFPGFRTTWEIADSGGKLSLRVCFTIPDSGRVGCNTLERLKPPEASVEGHWNFNGGIVRVTASGTGFIGTIVKETRVSVCPHPVGEVMWRFSKVSPGKYRGTHLGFKTARDCSQHEEHVATFTLANDRLSVRIGRKRGQEPGACGSSTDCYVLTRAAAPTAPPPAGSRSVSLKLDYTMPARFGFDGNRDGLLDYFTSRGAIAPSGWTVDFVVTRSDGRTCAAGDRFSWTADGKALAAAKAGTCRFRARFPKEGKFSVRASFEGGGAKGSGAATVIVQDWLIFGVGDSNGSGEGNPDIPASAIASARWEDRRCDRSAKSHQPLAAKKIEADDPKTSVTFVHLACSGASIVQGMVGPYRGINDPGGLPIESQLSEMQKLAGTREIDAVLISIGVNDLGFAQLVQFCITNNACPSAPFPDSSSKKSLDDVMKERLAALPGRYAQLAGRLKRLGIPPARVFITEYPDSTRDQAGKFCDPLIRVGPAVFSGIEAEWANEDVLHPLNAAVRAAAARHGWRVITRIADDFRTHGYCSSDPWIVGLVESRLGQGDVNGTLHANAVGHEVVGGMVTSAVKPSLYRNGIARTPAGR
jgi:lysophospholipase L1-like esterase